MKILVLTKNEDVRDSYDLYDLYINAVLGNSIDSSDKKKILNNVSKIKDIVSKYDKVSAKK